MASNPIIRVVTGKTSIPEGVAQAGTLSENSDHNDRLDYSGTAAALDAILGQGRFNSEQEKNNLWVYIPTSDLLLNILSWGGTVIKVDGDVTGVSGEAWELVESKICGWSVLNQGESAGAVDGVSLASGASLTFADSDEAGDRRRFLDAIQADGTGTSLLITEKY